MSASAFYPSFLPFSSFCAPVSFPPSLPHSFLLSSVYKYVFYVYMQNSGLQVGATIITTIIMTTTTTTTTTSATTTTTSPPTTPTHAIEMATK